MAVGNVATTPLQQITASTVAGVASTLLGHPMDTIKTHLQANPASKSSWETLRALRWNVFRGMGPPLVNAIVMNAVMFSVFDVVQESVSNPFAAALVSGFATAMISTPTDYIKIQSQLKGQSSWQALQQVCQRQGLLRMPVVLYQGHVANLGREGVFTTIYLGCYHFVRSTNDNLDRSRDLMAVAATSSLTGAVAWIVSYPLDTIKTLRQSGKSRQEIVRLWNTQGFRPFVQGCTNSTVRAMLVTSCRMVAYELCLASCLNSN